MDRSHPDDHEPAAGEAWIDSAIRAAGPSAAGPEEIERIVQAVIAERARVVVRRRKFRWLFLSAVAAAAALILGVVLWTPPRQAEKPPEAPSPAPIARKTEEPPAEPQAPKLEEVVWKALGEVQGKSGRAARLEAERAALRLAAGGSRSVEALKVSASADPALRTAALEVLSALGTKAAREAMADLIEEMARAGSLPEIPSREDLLSTDLLLRLASSERAGPWALSRLSARSPALAARMLLEKYPGLGYSGLGKGRSSEFIQAFLSMLPENSRSFARELARGEKKKLLELAEDLGHTGSPKAWPLLEALHSALGPDPTILTALGGIDHPGVAPLLEKALCLDPPRRGAALAALSRIDSPERALALYRTWASTRGSPAVYGMHLEITKALRKEGEIALEAIARIAREGPQQAVAMEAISEIFPDRAADVLIPLLGNEKLKGPALRSLKKVAGADRGPSPDSWRAWRDEQRRKLEENAALGNRSHKEAV